MTADAKLSLKESLEPFFGTPNFFCFYTACNGMMKPMNTAENRNLPQNLKNFFDPRTYDNEEYKDVKKDELFVPSELTNFIMFVALYHSQLDHDLLSNNNVMSRLLDSDFKTLIFNYNCNVIIGEWKESTKKNEFLKRFNNMFIRLGDYEYNEEKINIFIKKLDEIIFLIKNKINLKKTDPDYDDQVVEIVNNFIDENNLYKLKKLFVSLFYKKRNFNKGTLFFKKFCSKVLNDYFKLDSRAISFYNEYISILDNDNNSVNMDTFADKVRRTENICLSDKFRLNFNKIISENKSNDTRFYNIIPYIPTEFKFVRFNLNVGDGVGIINCQIKVTDGDELRQLYKHITLNTLNTYLSELQVNKKLESNAIFNFNSVHIEMILTDLKDWNFNAKYLLTTCVESVNDDLLNDESTQTLIDADNKRVFNKRNGKFFTINEKGEEIPYDMDKVKYSDYLGLTNVSEEKCKDIVYCLHQLNSLKPNEINVVNQNHLFECLKNNHETFDKKNHNFNSIYPHFVKTLLKIFWVSSNTGLENYDSWFEKVSNAKTIENENKQNENSPPKFWGTFFASMICENEKFQNYVKALIEFVSANLCLIGLENNENGLTNIYSEHAMVPIKLEDTHGYFIIPVFGGNNQTGGGDYDFSKKQKLNMLRNEFLMILNTNMKGGTFSTKPTNFSSPYDNTIMGFADVKNLSNNMSGGAYFSNEKSVSGVKSMEDHILQSFELLNSLKVPVDINFKTNILNKIKQMLKDEKQINDMNHVLKKLINLLQFAESNGNIADKPSSIKRLTLNKINSNKDLIEYLNENIGDYSYCIEEMSNTIKNNQQVIYKQLADLIKKLV